MPKQQQQGSSGNKKHGRNKIKCAHYRAMHTREKNKLRRVLRASGLAEAKRWAAQHNLSAYLRKLVQ